MSPIVLEKIERAISNGWPLRPVKGFAFNNIDYIKGTLIDDPKHILRSIEDLSFFPDGTTAVALIGKLLPGFICLDFDTELKDLQDNLKALIKETYKDEDLFLRIGNRGRIGQLWFKYDGEKPASENKLDIIAGDKRCDAIGQYKGEGLLYEWPHKNPYDNKPSELPELNEEFLRQAILLHQIAYPKEASYTGNTGARHDQLRDIAMGKIFAGEDPLAVYDELSNSDLQMEILADRPTQGNKDLRRHISSAFKKYFDSEEFERKEIFKENAYEAFSDGRPAVESGSLLDVIYRATKRNQPTHAKDIAFFSALSVCSWLLTYSARFKGIAPNLLIFYVAHSGAGKSTAGKLTKEMLNIDARLRPAYGDGLIRTESAFINSFQYSPVGYQCIDEYTQLLKGKKGAGSMTSGLTEKICQYYSDFPDNYLQKVSLKRETYGVCFGPKFCGLMFSTHQVKKHLSEEDFLGGIGRRTFMIVDDRHYLGKKYHKYSEEFFTPEEKELISGFICSNVFDADSEVSGDIYQTKDIASYRITTGKEGKSGPEYFSEAYAPNILINLEADAEVETYLEDKHIDKANGIKEMFFKQGNEVSSVVVNSFSEFTLKLSTIHALAGKKEPSSTIKMDSVDWAEKMFLHYMVDDLTSEMETVFDDTNLEKVVLLADKLMSKLEGKKNFTRSSNEPRSLFRGKARAHRNDVLSYLIANNKIEILNEEASKRSITYKIL